MTQISSDLTYGIIFVCQLKVNISYFLIFLPDDEAQFLRSVPAFTFLRLGDFLFVVFPALFPHVLDVFTAPNDVQRTTAMVFLIRARSSEFQSF